MPYYLSEYLGKGTVDDPFRPVGSEQPGWQAVDLRPDGGRTLEGRGRNACFLYLPVADTDSRLRKIGDDKTEKVSTAARNHLSTVAASVETSTLENALVRVLLSPKAETGLNPLSAGHDKMLRFFLGPIRWAMPVISGGSLPATDDFNRADADPIGGHWTTGNGSVPLAIVSNAIYRSNPAWYGAYWNVDSFTSNQYALCELRDAVNNGGPAVRMQTSGGPTAYAHLIRINAGADCLNYKVVGGSATEIQRIPRVNSVGDIAKIVADGSSISIYVNGTQVGTTQTDTSITGGSAGICGWYFLQLDNWEGGNVGVEGCNFVTNRRRRQ